MDIFELIKKAFGGGDATSASDAIKELFGNTEFKDIPEEAMREIRRHAGSDNMDKVFDILQEFTGRNMDAAREVGKSAQTTTSTYSEPEPVRAAVDPNNVPEYVVMEMKRLVDDGCKIQAVKYIQEVTGWNIVDAKAFVERYG